LSLIACTDCGNQVSRSAVACPSCGCPYNVIVGRPPQAPNANWLGEIMVGLFMLVTAFTAPALWPLLMLMLVVGLIHVVRKSPGLVPSRYPGEHLARRAVQPQRPLIILALRHILGVWLLRRKAT
jgi:MFS superfamily sulfate permease-like transporter